MNYPENPNPNTAFFADHLLVDPPSTDFELSDYLVFDDHHGFDEDSSSLSIASSEKMVDHRGGSSGFSSSGATSRNSSSNIKCRNRMKNITKVEAGHRVAFRTKSELEVMDDGFKWRKYGKKSVKNSPNPRNYYKCSNGGCIVKKRVERDREDSSYVITTYEGVHNHESPCVVYYNQMPSVMVPNLWTLQASSPPSSSSS